MEKIEVKNPEEILDEAIQCKEVAVVGQVCDCLLNLFIELKKESELFKKLDENDAMDLMLTVIATVYSNFGKEKETVGLA